ncbi:uncharacterized protein MONBRDRAFT_10323 [Monosiga brevicollis MX1]|uniref:Glycoside hydrolase family 5 domain-containing protein n=1 Tax=Monosiga brevicollis TaxID=81824 RepID=A9V5W2_MONBE|nr:uncharacterized protein MONBRDRAFT_10323 [Monosiga brevicollis MX1]EDQ87183.1 predicted protein [Monosiga brevicollis MX1]|eukprot:XP_001748126.1 hypothetical protein [Monosiga brevicollis MX1]
MCALRGLLGLLALLVAATMAANTAGSECGDQYILMNKAMGCTGDPYCWSYLDPAAVTSEAFENVTRTFPAAAHSRRHLGLSTQISVLDPANSTYLAFLQRILDMALLTKVPVAITLDPFEFWNWQAPYWNHWNQSQPGFNASNCHHVEWTGFDCNTDATRIAWRDWGGQFRVAPHPNIAHPAVMALHRAALAPAARLVAQWYDRLTPDQHYLLAFVKPMWEVWIGTNYYVYPNATRYVNQPASADPTGGVADAVQVGFAAICSRFNRCSGPPPTTAELDVIVREYGHALATVFTEAGLPAFKLMGHNGVNWPELPPSQHNVTFNSAWAGLNNVTYPGFSFYHAAYNPGAAAQHLADVLTASPRPCWGAAEWYYEGGNTGSRQEQWFAAFNNTMQNNNVLIDVFNWESFHRDPDAVAALNQFLALADSSV